MFKSINVWPQRSYPIGLKASATYFCSVSPICGEESHILGLFKLLVIYLVIKILGKGKLIPKISTILEILR